MTTPPKKGAEKEIREPGKTRKPGEGQPSNPPEKKDDEKPTDAPSGFEPTLTPAGHALGWRPSLPDFNDFAAEVEGMHADGEVDPRGLMPPVYDQGQLGSCTANAIAAAMEYDCILDGTEFGTPSRLFIYYGEREREGTVGTDSGAYGRDGFKVLRKVGVPCEEDWPYDISQFAVRPPDAAFEGALGHKIQDYVHPGLGPRVSKLERVEAFKRLLSNRQTIAFGFTVYESFEGAWDEVGVMPTPVKGEAVLGGHEVLLVGYLNEYPDHGLVRNSWGSDWGMGGYFLMPWQFLADPRYSGDWRSIYRPLSS
jgi:C1A family cysteine protease